MIQQLAVAPSHTAEYRRRRFVNWFPLGLTYATLYMGRYNLNVTKGTIQDLFRLTKPEMGIVATAGFWTYAASTIVNGPLTDRIGGKRAILLGAFGAAAMNLLIGFLFLGKAATHIVLSMSLLYSLNMYFQSFGAASIVKVNAAWFHVRERGVFGGIFGSMISLGYTLAFSVGGLVLAKWGLAWVFIVPAGVIAGMAIVECFLVRDTPSGAGFADIATGDASSGDETPVSFGYIAKAVFANPVMLTIAAAEFCTGFVRQGLLLYFPEFLKEVYGITTGSREFTWASNGPMVGGIAGGMLCGVLSDKLFQSRRPPVAFLFYLGQIVCLISMNFIHAEWLAAAWIGFTCMWIFGVHGMLSGTASMDFGGKKAAASAAGLLDGIQYVGAGLTGIGLGWLIQHYGWRAWTWSIVPFSVAGALLMLVLWNARPKPHASH